MTELNKTNIDNVIKNKNINLIFFYSSFDPSSTQRLKIFEEFERLFNNKIKIYICDYDYTDQYVKEYFQMKTLPGIMIMRSGKEYANLAGPASKLKYENLIKEAILKILNEDKKI